METRREDRTTILVLIYNSHERGRDNEGEAKSQRRGRNNSRLQSLVGSYCILQFVINF